MQKTVQILIVSSFTFMLIVMPVYVVLILDGGIGWFSMWIMAILYAALMGILIREPKVHQVVDVSEVVQILKEQHQDAVEKIKE